MALHGKKQQELAEWKTKFVRGALHQTPQINLLSKDGFFFSCVPIV